MKKLMLICEQADGIKQLEAALSEKYSVNTASLSPEVVYDTLEVVKPDVIVIPLEGARDSDKAVFRHISTNYPKTPVITIGSYPESNIFSQYYKDEQFENIPGSSDTDAVLAAVERRCAAGAGERRTASILVVDDDMSVLRSVKAMLEDEYEVFIATSGAMGMKIIEKKVPDLILLDYEMPECDGRQVFGQLKQNELTKNVPVVFLTGMTDQKYTDSITGLGPHGYIVKPADPIRLKETIEKILYIL